MTYNDSKPADHRTLGICATYNEMQQGPNPLSPDDVRKLIDRHPGRYDVLEACATPPASAEVSS